MTRSYGMIFFFFCQWTIRFTLNFVSTFNTHKPTNIYCGTWYVYIFAEFLFLKISQIAPKKLEEKATEKEGENSRKINCPLSPSDTITAEKLEHQLLPPGSRWKITFLLRWENGLCFQVFGVWIHSPLGHWNCCSKALITEILKLPFFLVYWLGEIDFSWNLFYLCVACSGLEASRPLLWDGEKTQGTHSLLSLSSSSGVSWNRFKGLDLIECLKNYGQRFMTLYRRKRSRSSPRKRNAKKKNSCLRRPYK